LDDVLAADLDAAGALESLLDFVSVAGFFSGEPLFSADAVVSVFAAPDSELPDGESLELDVAPAVAGFLPSFP
jgi:hypothetical protein